MVAKVLSVALVGYEGALIEVESDAKQGLPGVQIVGMGNKAIDESRDRVRSAINNSLLDFPKTKLTINLAPAELPKDGAHFDLPIAVAILINSGQLRQTEVDNALFAGELALDGSLRAIRGAISIAEIARDQGLTTLYVPVQNASQATLIEGITVIGVRSLKELYLHLKGETPLRPHQTSPEVVREPETTPVTLDDIHGQQQAKRALIIAAAGHHNILLCGSPGAGKTMLAQALPSLLTPLSRSEQLAVTKLHNLAGEADEQLVQSRPFRAPHHTATTSAIIGGGTPPRPGEVSLAHLGVLFLDELPEYQRTTLEALRQPLEDKRVSVARVKGRVTYPSQFMLVATMNPCPCGYADDPAKECTCNPYQISTYQKRLSGPLLDRIDLVVNVSRAPTDTLLQKNTLQESHHSKDKKLVQVAKARQKTRYKSSKIYNASLSSKQVKELLQLSDRAKNLLTTAADKLGLSARAYFKIIKVAQTIADLEGAPVIDVPHISEALQFRDTLLKT